MDPQAAGVPLTPGFVILAGGRSHRFGSDKVAAPLGRTTVLDRLLDDLEPGMPVVVVGPPRPVRRPVTFTRENPPHGGPAAALAAGCAALGARVDPIVVLAGDAPFAASAGHRLLDALAADVAGQFGGVVGVDPAGRRQPLVGAFRRGPLQAALRPDPAGRSMRWVCRQLVLAELRLTAEESLDVDTRQDLDTARAIAEARWPDVPPAARRPRGDDDTRPADA